MFDQIDISKLNKAEVLAALYNNAKPQGLGFLHYTPKNMTAQEASTILAQTARFDYLYGRVMKVNLSGDFLRTSLYDRYNGQGAAFRAIAHLLDDYSQLLEDAERYNRWWRDSQERRRAKDRKIAALRGVITKLKRRK